MQIAKRSLSEIIAERKLQRTEEATQQLLSEDVIIPILQAPPIQEIKKPTISQIIAAKKAGIFEHQKTKIIKDSIQPSLILEPKKLTLTETLALKKILKTEADRVDYKVYDDPIYNDDLEDKDAGIVAPIETFSLKIILNDKQLLAKDMALSGKSFALTGAAGTGKTTALREIAKALLTSDRLQEHDFRVQGSGDRCIAPSIAFIAWTRIASGNIRRAIHKDPDLEKALTCNITTAHNLLEYQPEYFYDDVKEQESMRFVPKRNKYHPLTLTHLVVEESTLIDIPMWQRLYEALPTGVQIIFVGDINQLPPVFGASIFNYALTSLPTIELTHVYRQAGDSTVLENAHRILEGKELIEADDFKIVRCGTMQHSQEKLSISLGKTFPQWMDKGVYDPDTDIILSPWNKHDLGTDVINKWIAQVLGTKRKAIVHQIVAGRATHFLAIGDKVMYNKQKAKILDILHNPLYMGRETMLASVNLNRFGGYTARSWDTKGKSTEDEFDTEGYHNLDLDRMLDEDIDITKQSSHHVVILTEDEIEIILETVGDFSPSSFSLGYALTVHKAQGCEWKRVFLIMHAAHNISLSREFIYTAVTRAREVCTIIAKEHLINKVISQQRLKGKTLADKIEYFNTGLLNQDNIFCTK